MRSDLNNYIYLKVSDSLKEMNTSKETKTGPDSYVYFSGGYMYIEWGLSQTKHTSSLSSACASANKHTSKTFCFLLHKQNHTRTGPHNKGAHSSRAVASAAQVGQPGWPLFLPVRFLPQFFFPLLLFPFQLLSWFLHVETSLWLVYLSHGTDDPT